MAFSSLMDHSLAGGVPASGDSFLAFSSNAP